jgi:hypothetical protein
VEQPNVVSATNDIKTLKDKSLEKLRTKRVNRGYNPKYSQGNFIAFGGLCGTKRAKPEGGHDKVVEYENYCESIEDEDENISSELDSDLSYNE